MRLAVLFAMTRLSQAYFSYSTSRYDDPLRLNSVVVPDIVPSWAGHCFNDTLYKGPLCTPTQPIPGGIMYVQCPGECTSEMVDAYHAYGAYKDMSGIVFRGHYPEKASCKIPSTFILEDIEPNGHYYAHMGVHEPNVSFARIVVAYRWGMLIVSFLFISVILCTYTQSRRLRRANAVQIIIAEELQEPHGQNVRVITDTKHTPERGETTCPICIEPFEDGETVSVLACGHAYKPRCIRDWLKKESRCPLCNATE